MNPPAKPERGEPNFDNIDNPGAWPSFIFCPTFASRAKTSKYKHHALPTGCVPVPVNEDGNREVNGWKFYYQGWKNDKMPY